jgi:hypothetical protein
MFDKAESLVEGPQAIEIDVVFLRRAGEQEDHLLSVGVFADLLQPVLGVAFTSEGRPDLNASDQSEIRPVDQGDGRAWLPAAGGRFP